MKAVILILALATVIFIAVVLIIILYVGKLVDLQNSIIDETHELL